MRDVSPVPDGCGFTETHYAAVIRQLSSARRMFTFGDFEAEGGCTDPFLLVRHDVDVSLDAAVTLGGIEAEAGQSSTFFVRIGARGYDVTSGSSRERLRQIVQWGGEIGLHQEVTLTETDADAIATQLRRGRELLEDLVGEPVGGVSTHMPKRTRAALTREIIEAAGFRYEAGAATFNPPGRVFLSDSNRSWKGRCPCRYVDSRASGIYLLVHPIWWHSSSPPTDETVRWLVRGN